MKKRNPKSIVEEKDPRFEYGYMRYPGEELQDVTLSNPKEHEVNWDLKKYVEIKNRKDYRHQFLAYHNHPKRGLPFTLWNVGASPSSGDMIGFIDEPKQKSMYIFQRDSKTGEVEGIYVLRKPRDFGKEKVPRLMTYPQMFDNHVRRTISPKRATRLLAEQYGLRYRFIPAKGYKMNWRGIFVKKKSSQNIEDKISVFIGLGSILLSLIFLSNNITGNAIGTIDNRSSNMAGIIFLLVGLIFIFSHIKQK